MRKLPTAALFSTPMAFVQHAAMRSAAALRKIANATLATLAAR